MSSEEQKIDDSEMGRRDRIAAGGMQTAFVMGMIVGLVSTIGLIVTKWF